MLNFTENDKPLLAYSWLPRAGLMTASYVRITMESFYHCGGTSQIPDPTSLADPLEREVTACDYPIEHVEKAVVWRLQQPSSTKAALFVNAFRLNASQLNRLLEIGGDLNLFRSSTPSAAQLDEAACLWLNDNTATWEAWLPDFELYDSVLYQWEMWLIVCCAVSFLGRIFLHFYLQHFKDCEEEAEAWIEDQSSMYSSMYSSWPDQPAARYHPVVACLSWTGCCKLINRVQVPKQWDPVFDYLSNALRCMVNAAEKCEDNKKRDDRKTNDNDWGFISRLVTFALGQLFVGVSNGFLEGLIYDSFLTNGLNQLSLEVTISCAILMLTLYLVKSGLSSLPSGESIVQRQLQIRLRIKYHGYTARILNKFSTNPDLNQAEEKEEAAEEAEEAAQVGVAAEAAEEEAEVAADNATKLYCVEQFDKAINFTAKELASDCYSAAWSVLSEFLGFLSAVGFLFYYTFNEGIPQDMSNLMIAAFICAPGWLIIVLLIGPWAKTGFSCAKGTSLNETPTNDGGGGGVDSVDSGGGCGGGCGGYVEAVRKFFMTTTDYKMAYGGILLTCVYFLWAFGPILINPLKNDFGPGTNSIPLTDLLTASRRYIYIYIILQHH